MLVIMSVVVSACVVTLIESVASATCGGVVDAELLSVVSASVVESVVSATCGGVALVILSVVASARDVVRWTDSVV